MEGHINLEERSDGTSSLACHTNTKTKKTQIKTGGKRKSIYWEHLNTSSIQRPRKLRKQNASIDRRYCLLTLIIEHLL